MHGLEDFGCVWMASSPLTDRWPPIKRAIDSGVDAIVLKSITTVADAEQPKEGKREILKGSGRGMLYDMLIPYTELTEEPHMPFDLTLTCSSTAKDIEMISIEEGNQLFDQIKDYNPSIKVIPNFAPMSLDDFHRFDEIKGDALELSTRWVPMGIKKPFVAMVVSQEDQEGYPQTGSLYWQPLLKQYSAESIVQACIDEHKQYEEAKERKLKLFEEGVQTMSRSRPIILKLSRDYYEMNLDDYIALPFDGFTFSDSKKSTESTCVGGYQVDLYGKGSIMGGNLQYETICFSKFLKEQIGPKHLSASGGILDVSSAKQTLANGADSVQLCSVVYWHGWDPVKAICDSVKR